MRELLILYGSQTGCAEEVAESLFRNASRFRFSVHLSSLDHFDIKQLLYSRLAIFVCSTTGQGDPPSNMRKFWKFIMRRNLPADSLTQLHFAVIGLGDSSYPKYNFVAKKLFRRLSQLSANQLLPPILADDQHQLGADAALDEAVPKLWWSIKSLFPLPGHLREIPSSQLLPPKYKINILDNQLSKEPVKEVSDAPKPISDSVTTTSPSSSSPFLSRLISNDRITSRDHFQDVRLIRLDITDSNIRYQPGDVAYLRPQNSSENVSHFLSLLSLNGDQQISIQPHSGQTLPSGLASVMTWKELATNHLDLSAVPRRYFFELLSHFSQSDLEKEKLLEFCSPEGQDERFAYCNRVRRSSLEVLTEFTQTTPHIHTDYVLDLLPPLQPRAFSIASSQSNDDKVIELLVAVVNYKTKLSAPRLGVCSNWLANMQPSSHCIVPLWTEKGTLRFPKDGEPCILIGPGTGVAPFRSFIQHRESLGYHSNLLVFGNRNKDGDFLCGDEWQSLSSAGKLTLLTAFSRDQQEKYYVWNALADNSDLMWRWLQDLHSFIFIAGNAKRMPDDVRSCFVKIFKDKLDVSSAEAEECVQRLESEGRYQLECW